MNTQVTPTSLGELISALYEEYMELYGDEDLASVATAATINELIGEASTASRGDPLETLATAA